MVLIDTQLLPEYLCVIKIYVLKSLPVSALVN